jgi:hypothetical protein
VSQNFGCRAIKFFCKSFFPDLGHDIVFAASKKKRIGIATGNGNSKVEAVFIFILQLGGKI